MLKEHHLRQVIGPLNVHGETSSWCRLGKNRGLHPTVETQHVFSFVSVLVFLDTIIVFHCFSNVLLGMDF